MKGTTLPAPWRPSPLPWSSGGLRATFRGAPAAHPLQHEHTMAPLPRRLWAVQLPCGLCLHLYAKTPCKGPEFEARPPRAAAATALRRRKFIEYERREGETFPWNASYPLALWDPGARAAEPWAEGLPQIGPRGELSGRTQPRRPSTQSSRGPRGAVVANQSREPNEWSANWPIRGPQDELPVPNSSL